LKKLNKRISVRIRKQQYQQLKSISKLLDIPISDLVRHGVDFIIRVHEPLIQKIDGDLKKLGEKLKAKEPPFTMKEFKVSDNPMPQTLIVRDLRAKLLPMISGRIGHWESQLYQDDQGRIVIYWVWISPEVDKYYHLEIIDSLNELKKRLLDYKIEWGEENEG